MEGFGAAPLLGVVAPGSKAASSEALELVHCPIGSAMEVREVEAALAALRGPLLRPVLEVGVARLLASAWLGDRRAAALVPRAA